jgi:putative ABC transport system substrate-binding protein
LRQRLRELGYLEGQNIAFESRAADGTAERLADLAAELVRLKVSLIVTAGNRAALAAKKATTTIPIVMATGNDPVGLGLIASLSRPGENVTGLTTVAVELGGKRLELLREVVPRLSRVAVLRDPRPGIVELALEETQVAAQALGVQLPPGGG